MRMTIKSCSTVNRVRMTIWNLPWLSASLTYLRGCHHIAYKMYPTKTEFIWLETSKRNHLIDHSPISISRTQITPLPKFKMLEVHTDEELSLSVQISRTVISGFFHLRQIKAIRRCLPSDAARFLVYAFVVPRLDYWYSIYAGQPKPEINR